MICVTYHPELFQVHIQGHARSGEFGRDLICAGCSTLAVTLGDNVTALKASGAVRDFQVDIRSGDARINCNPVSKYKATVRLVFDSVCMGFKRLATQYPDYICYESRG